jgi:hypothetical protein
VSINPSYFSNHRAIENAFTGGSFANNAKNTILSCSGPGLAYEEAPASAAKEL